MKNIHYSFNHSSFAQLVACDIPDKIFTIEANGQPYVELNCTQSTAAILTDEDLSQHRAIEIHDEFSFKNMEITQVSIAQLQLVFLL